MNHLFNMEVTIPAPNSATYAATRRLQKDYQKLAQDPIDGISALPNEANILEWHYCLRGSPDTVYEGGYYWGKIVFKPDFPWSPPAIIMITPNGRFQTNVRLCLSISDYHPESWNPGWTVSAILVGLHSFMNEKSHAAGVQNSSPSQCREFASKSKDYNMQCKEFVQFFPGLTSEWSGGASSSSLASTSSSGSNCVPTTSSSNPSSSSSRPRANARTAAEQPNKTNNVAQATEEPPRKRTRAAVAAAAAASTSATINNNNARDEDIIVLD